MARTIDQVLFLVAATNVLKHRHPYPHEQTEKTPDGVVQRTIQGIIHHDYPQVYFGTPPKGLLDQYTKTAQIECRMISATRPESTTCPHLIGKKAYEEFGYGDMYYKHHQGGPQGYYNREYLVSELRHEKAMPNQCYCYNPVVSGTKTEDAFIAMEEGPLFITKPVSFPKLTITEGPYTMERPGLLVL
jgi:hypothetical protein